MSWGVYPDFLKAGSYGYDVSKENMFDYDKRELANVLVHFLWLGVCKHKCFLAKMFYQNIGPSSVHVFHMY
jgi:hypothetical protein